MFCIREKSLRQTIILLTQFTIMRIEIKVREGEGRDSRKRDPGRHVERENESLGSIAEK